MKRSSQRIHLLLVGAAATLAVYSGCAFLDSAPSGVVVPFSHRVHLETKIECTDCHVRDPETGDVGQSRFAVCQICHEQKKIAPAPAERFDRLYVDAIPLGPFVTTLDDEIIFDHVAHLETDDCRACHGALVASDDIEDRHRLSKPDCMGCHRSKAASLECATCHRVVRRDSPPPSHSQNWEHRHGLVSQKRQDLCTLCHDLEGGANSCAGCHLVTEPRNHTEQFKRRGHGLLVGLDRRQCQTCHETDFCVRCHENTRPVSHRGMWGTGRNVHCISCHLPVASEPSCRICHLATPGHATAAPQPADHVPGANCRLCHGFDAPLPHVDNGSNCAFCHP